MLLFDVVGGVVGCRVGLLVWVWLCIVEGFLLVCYWLVFVGYLDGVFG